MRNLLVISALFISIISGAQENVKTEGNSVSVTETAPVWPGCENTENSENCFSEKFLEHVKNNYKYPRKDTGDFIRGKATVTMHVDKNGVAKIDDIKAEEPKVKKAVAKMLSNLPKMTPGEKAGKPASIKYTIPLQL